MAARYWPGQDAIGKRFQMGGPGSTRPMMTIVGIVRTSRHNAVVEPPRAEMYLPHAQAPISVGGPVRGLAIVVKTATDPLAFVETLRQTVRQMDRNLPIAEIQGMEQIAADAVAGPRFAALLLALFVSGMTVCWIGTDEKMLLSREATAKKKKKKKGPSRWNGDRRRGCCVGSRLCVRARRSSWRRSI